MTCWSLKRNSMNENHLHHLSLGMKKLDQSICSVPCSWYCNREETECDPSLCMGHNRLRLLTVEYSYPVDRSAVQTLHIQESRYALAFHSIIFSLRTSCSCPVHVACHNSVLDRAIDAGKARTERTAANVTFTVKECSFFPLQPYSCAISVHICST